MSLGYYTPQADHHQLTKSEYVNTLNQLSNAALDDPLIVTDKALAVTNKVQWVLNKIKGFFGFEDRTEIVRVNYELLKLLRYGKKKHFHDDINVQQTVQVLSKKLELRPQIDKAVKDCFTLLNTHNTAAVDENIKTYYNQHGNELRPSFWSRITSKHTEESQRTSAIFESTIADQKKESPITPEAPKPVIPPEVETATNPPLTPPSSPKPTTSPKPQTPISFDTPPPSPTSPRVDTSVTELSESDEETEDDLKVRDEASDLLEQIGTAIEENNENEAQQLVKSFHDKGFELPKDHMRLIVGALAEVGQYEAAAELARTYKDESAVTDLQLDELAWYVDRSYLEQANALFSEIQGKMNPVQEKQYHSLNATLKQKIAEKNQLDEEYTALEKSNALGMQLMEIEALVKKGDLEQAGKLIHTINAPENQQLQDLKAEIERLILEKEAQAKPKPKPPGAPGGAIEPSTSADKPVQAKPKPRELGGEMTMTRPTRQKEAEPAVTIGPPPDLEKEKLAWKIIEIESKADAYEENKQFQEAAKAFLELFKLTNNPIYKAKLRETLNLHKQSLQPPILPPEPVTIAIEKPPVIEPIAPQVFSVPTPIVVEPAKVEAEIVEALQTPISSPEPVAIAIEKLPIIEPMAPQVFSVPKPIVIEPAKVEAEIVEATLQVPHESDLPTDAAPEKRTLEEYRELYANAAPDLQEKIGPQYQEMCITLGDKCLSNANSRWTLPWNRNAYRIAAIAAYKEAVAIRAASYEYLNRYITAYIELGEQKEAALLYETLLKQFPDAKLSIDPSTYRLHYIAESELMVANGKYDEAISRMQLGLDRTQEISGNDYLMLYQILIKKRDYRGALIQLKEAVRLGAGGVEDLLFLAQNSSDNKIKIFHLAKAYEMQSENQDVARAYFDALKTEVDTLDILNQLPEAEGYLTQALKVGSNPLFKYNTDTELTADVAKLNEKKIKLHTDMANKASIAMKWRDAIHHYLKVQEQHAQDPNFFFNLGKCYLRLGEMQAARGNLYQALDLLAGIEPPDELRVMLECMGKTQEELENMVYTRPSNHHYGIELAHRLVNQGKVSEALSKIQITQAQFPGIVEVDLVVANVLKKQGSLANGEKSLAILSNLYAVRGLDSTLYSAIKTTYFDACIEQANRLCDRTRSVLPYIFSSINQDRKAACTLFDKARELMPTQYIAHASDHMEMLLGLEKYEELGVLYDYLKKSAPLQAIPMYDEVLAHLATSAVKDKDKVTFCQLLYERTSTPANLEQLCSAYINYANVLSTKGHDEEAIQQLKHAFYLKPNDVNVLSALKTFYRNRADAFAQNGDRAAALNQMQQVKAPWMRPETQDLRKIADLRRQERPEDERTLRRLVAQHEEATSEDFLALADLATSHYEQITNLEKAYALEPTSVEIANKYLQALIKDAKIKQQSASLDEAMASLTLANEICRKFPQFQEVLPQIIALQNRLIVLTKDTAASQINLLEAITDPKLQTASWREALKTAYVASAQEELKKGNIEAADKLLLQAVQEKLEPSSELLLEAAMLHLNYVGPIGKDQEHTKALELVARALQHPPEKSQEAFASLGPMLTKIGQIRYIASIGHSGNSGYWTPFFNIASRCFTLAKQVSPDALYGLILGTLETEGKEAAKVHYEQLAKVVGENNFELWETQKKHEIEKMVLILDHSIDHEKEHLKNKYDETTNAKEKNDIQRVLDQIFTEPLEAKRRRHMKQHELLHEW